MEVEPAARRIIARGERGEAVVTLVEPTAIALQQDDDFGGFPAVYWRQGKNYPLPNQWHGKASIGPVPATRIVAVIQVSRLGQPKPALRAVADGVETAGWRVRLPAGATRLLLEKLP